MRFVTRLPTTKNFPGATGNITINADRKRRQRKAFIVQVKDGGTLKFVTTIKP